MARGDRFPGTRPTMPAVDLHGRDGFALLARAFVELGAKEHLPALPAAGARDVASALASASALVQAGVPAEVSARGRRSATRSGADTGRRGDLPVRREVRRACKRSALEAALAEHRLEALADLDENVLARSSQGPFQSRVRTWVDLCQAWAVDPWPISLEAVRSVAGVAASRRLYRSAQNYFDAAVAYQERFREQAVDPLLKKAMRRYTRSVLRGLPGPGDDQRPPGGTGVVAVDVGTRSGRPPPGGMVYAP